MFQTIHKDTFFRRKKTMEYFVVVLFIIVALVVGVKILWDKINKE